MADHVDMPVENAEQEPEQQHEPESKYDEPEAERHAEPEAPPEIDPLSTYEGRAAAVAKMGGNLEKHLCCPTCFDQRAIKDDDKAKCDVCGWTGFVVNLLDTVQTGATKL